MKLGALALFGLVALGSVDLDAQHPELAEAPVEGVSFRVYDREGRSRSFADVLAALDGADALLVGESHDDVVGHQVEAQILYRAAERFGVVGDTPDQRPVVLSLEMFERDVQYIVDEYLAGLIIEDQFKRSARPWDRYDTDYRPMVEFARAHGMPVLAANAPRRYVNRVTRLGAASLLELPDEAHRFLPPLPYPGPSEAYKAEWDALMAEMMDEMRGGAPEDPEELAEPEKEAGAADAAPSNHGMGFALDSQALWDASMGHAVARALEETAGALVVHYAGSFHVQNYTGILERVRDYRPDARVVTVVLEPAEDIDGWNDDEHEGLGDFVVLTLKPEES